MRINLSTGSLGLVNQPEPPSLCRGSISKVGAEVDPALNIGHPRMLGVKVKPQVERVIKKVIEGTCQAIQMLLQRFRGKEV
jgi:hypothetical protein